MIINAMDDDEPRPLTAVISDLLRRKEESVNRVIKKAQESANMRLEDRYNIIMKNAEQTEKQHVIFSNARTPEQIGFFEDLERQQTLKSKSNAYKAFRRNFIKMAMPKWQPVVEECKGYVSQYGHTNKHRWRSRVIQCCNEILVQLESNSNGSLDMQCRSLIHHIHISVNLLNANEMNRRLDDILSLYSTAISDEFDKKYGEHSDLTSFLPTHRFNTSRGKLSNLPFRVSAATAAGKEQSRSTSSQQSSRRIQSRPGSPKLPSSSRVGSPNGGIVIHLSPTRAVVIMNLESEKIVRDAERLNELTTYSKIIAVFRKLSMLGEYDYCWRVYNQLFETSREQPGGNSIPDSERCQLSLEMYHLLLIAYKHHPSKSQSQVDSIKAAMKARGIDPDITFFNIYISTCIPNSQWRKAIIIYTEMREEWHVLPNAATFELLLDCCRHAVDEPAVIFDTMRLADIPVNFCYKCSLLNAGNRISEHVMVESVQNLTLAHELTHFPAAASVFPPPSSSCSCSSVMSADMSVESLDEEQFDFKDFTVKMRKHLSKRSPSRQQLSRSYVAFNRTIARCVTPILRSTARMNDQSIIPVRSLTSASDCSLSTHPELLLEDEMEEEDDPVTLPMIRTATRQAVRPLNE